mmetsp:Transcript_25716/g.59653  ORF Transcript_25716/g.59653 Transcript_25716/m.59653 type:complete len:119 (+) Transcript_25716:3-359(+)
MDGLEALEHQGGGGGGSSSAGDLGQGGETTSEMADASPPVPSLGAAKRGTRGRQRAPPVPYLPGGASHSHKPKKLDAKQIAIRAKMRALTAQISNDFNKVTMYGKKAGYVPPPKIPHV